MKVFSFYLMLSALDVHERTSMYIVQYCIVRNLHFTSKKLYFDILTVHNISLKNIQQYIVRNHMVHLFLTFVSYGMNTNLVTQADCTASLQQFRVLV